MYFWWVRVVRLQEGSGHLTEKGYQRMWKRFRERREDVYKTDNSC